MDSIDNKIIKILKENGRTSHEEIGRLLNISRPAIHQRINKLEKENIISGYTTNINWEKLGQTVKAFVYIKVVPANFKEIVNTIVKIDIPNVAIEDCHRLSGEWCISTKVRAHSPKDISNLIDALSKINGVKETSTTFVLSTLMEDSIIEE